MAALFMAMNIALSSFGIPVPGGHLYINDIVICLAALLFTPKEEGILMKLRKLFAGIAAAAMPALSQEAGLVGKTRSLFNTDLNKKQKI